MNITNKHNLTDAFVEAVKNDAYSRGESDFTVTQLIKPPQLDQLMREHDAKLSEDAADRVWSVLGQAIHAVLERRVTPSELSEERLYVILMGKKVGGQFDSIHIQKKRLVDYKCTSCWAAVHGKEEWVQQLNMLRYLAIKNGHEVDSLHIQGIWRDWNRMTAMNNESYPQAPSTMIDIPVWSIEETESFILARLVDHTQPTPRPCTDEERWYRDEKWALMKKGRKSAVKLEDTEEKLIEVMTEKGLYKDGKWAKDHYVEFRKGTYKRCEDYCSAGKAGLCPQWNLECGLENTST